MNFMSDDALFEFVDTNILVYAYDRSAGDKRQKAAAQSIFRIICRAARQTGALDDRQPPKEKEGETNEEHIILGWPASVLVVFDYFLRLSYTLGVFAPMVELVYTAG